MNGVWVNDNLQFARLQAFLSNVDPEEDWEPILITQPDGPSGALIFTGGPPPREDEIMSMAFLMDHYLKVFFATEFGDHV